MRACSTPPRRPGSAAAYNTPDTADDLDLPGKLDLGADARLRLGRLLVAGEFLCSRFEEPYSALDPTGLDGGYATLGFDLTPDDRVLARLDVIAVEFSDDASTQILLGYNRTLTRAASVQATVVVPVSDAADGCYEPLQALLNLQLAV